MIRPVPRAAALAGLVATLLAGPGCGRVAPSTREPQRPAVDASAPPADTATQLLEDAPASDVTDGRAAGEMVARVDADREDSAVDPRGNPGPEAAEAGVPAALAELVSRLQVAEVRSVLGTLQQMSQPNRATGTDSYRRVTEWVRDMVAEKGPALSVRFDDRGGLRNVELRLPGSDPAAGMYLLGGHLDSEQRTPGIDDNGSGSLGTVLVALALSHYRFRSELRFVLFDAEEQGLIGSAAYAKALRDSGCAPGTCLRFFLNLDMIGHDPANRSLVQVFTAVGPIFDLLRRVEAAQGIGLSVVRGGTDRCNASDDCSFSQHGYDAGYVFEAVYFPGYHTPRDTVDVINFETMTRTLRLVAAALATAAVMEGPRPGL